MNLSSDNYREKEFHNKLQASSKSRFENICGKSVDDRKCVFHNRCLDFEVGYIGGQHRNTTDNTRHKKMREGDKKITET